MTDVDFVAVQEAITEAYPRLSPQLRLAAENVVDKPEDVALMSMRSFAEVAGVHPSTLVRLAKALSFEGYREFQSAFQRSLTAQPGNFAARARALHQRDAGGEDIVTEIFSATDENLRRMMEINGPDKFALCAKRLADASRIDCIGRRSCFAVAHVFAYLSNMFRQDVRLIDGTGGSLTDGLRRLSKNDVLLAVAVAPYSVQTVAAVDIARERGVGIIALTDSPVSPVAVDPETTIVVPNESRSFFQSVAPLTLAAEILAALAMLARGQEALDAIEESEAYLQRLMAYWRNPVEVETVKGMTR